MDLDVKPKWRKLFLHKDVKPHLDKALSNLSNETIPKREHIFQAFTYFDLDELRTVIVGQDPYPRDVAMGLSFSVPNDVPVPKSLKKIYECLEYSQLIKSVPTHGDLTSWAKQGVLLLNKYLTYGEKPHTFWDDFTTAILHKLVIYFYKKGRPLSIMLWGKRSQSVIPKLRKELCTILTWTHPSPANSKRADDPANFKFCTHFRDVNDILARQTLPIIDWSIENAKQNEKQNAKQNKQNAKQIVIFTDGGCTKNGSKSAVASYAVYAPDKFMNFDNAISKRMFGLVEPFTMVNSKWTKTPCAPTNNRGELLAILYALSMVLEYVEQNMPLSVMIISDSTYCINIASKWIWSWSKDFATRKNPDLLQNIWGVLTKLDALYKKNNLVLLNEVKFIHQRSHKKPPAKDGSITGGFEYEKHAGNEIADELCTLALRGSTTPL